MVPQKVLDTELKKSFAHFHEGRIPVSMWGFGFPSQVLAIFQPRMCHLGHRVCCVAALVLETPLGQRSAADGQFSEQHLS